MAKEALVAENPDWGSFGTLRVSARPGIVSIQGNRMQPLDFELTRLEERAVAVG